MFKSRQTKDRASILIQAVVVLSFAVRTPQVNTELCLTRPVSSSLWQLVTLMWLILVYYVNRLKILCLCSGEVGF